MSPSVWWDDCAVYKIVDAIDETARPPLKIWLDTGTREEGWERARELRDRLVLKGWRLHDDLQYLEADGSDHSEGAWAARMDPVLRFLFPPLPPGTETSRRPRLAAARNALNSILTRTKRLAPTR
jgi:predicted alpha/beta superfamily hydrolase